VDGFGTSEQGQCPSVRNSIYTALVAELPGGTSGGDQSDHVFGLAVDDQGNTYVVGTTDPWRQTDKWSRPY
jgi:hypothetical protein